MKKILLSVAFLAAVNAFAQSPIQSFYSASLIPEESNTIHYLLVDPDSPLDQSVSGANVSWNFNNLTEVTQTATTTMGASAQDVANYPGTTLDVETVTQGGNTTHYYLAEGEGTYLTGAETSQMTLAYSDPALIGYFPMQYGASTNDVVSGTFDGQGFQGTFTGTTATSVDAYGTLTVNTGLVEPMSVTRLKTQQNLSLIYMGFPVGTLTQTAYSYYSPNIYIGPIFRTIETHIVVEALSIDQTQSSVEVYSDALNGIEEHMLQNSIVIAPNPVNDLLHFEGNAEISNVKVVDATGREVLRGAGNDIQAAHLPSGIYLVQVSNGNGSQSLKMVKQ